MSDKNSIIYNKSHLLEMLVESTKTAYIILNQNSEILEANEYFLKMIKCDNPIDIIGKSSKVFICEKDLIKYDSAIQELLNGNEVISIELCINNNILSKQDNIWVNIKAGLMKNGTTKIFCIINNITNIKNQEISTYISLEKKKDKIKQSLLRLKELNKIKG